MTFEYDADDFRTAAGKSRNVSNQLTGIINTLNAANLPLSASLDVASINLGVFRACGSPQVQK